MKLKDDLAKEISNANDITMNEAYGAVTYTVETISKMLIAGESVQLKGLGVFEVKQVAAKVGRNPKTGETVQIPVHRKVSFRPSTQIKDALKK